MTSLALGEAIPPDTAHAVSVSLPTWQSNIGYEEGEEWVTSRMRTGYPRFFIHKSIESLAEAIVASHCQPSLVALLFATPMAARRCIDFVRHRTTSDEPGVLDTIELVTDASKCPTLLKQLSPTITAAIFPRRAFALAKQYWQHTGDGISSRRAEFCHGLLTKRMLVPASQSQFDSDAQSCQSRGPKRYQTTSVSEYSLTETDRSSSSIDFRDSSSFLEERFGRNLDLNLVEQAKSAIRRRIAGSLSQEADQQLNRLPFLASIGRGTQVLDEHDVYLFPAGMNAIFHVHRALLAARGQMRSVSFGFPYVDSLKILQKFGPGCDFYGHGSSEDLDDLETRLRSGQRYLGLFCEFPGNPLLTCPDLNRIRQLADEFSFAVVVDETIGTFANINVLPVADIIVSSLTKIFSGDSNVMGGSAVLNPRSRYYSCCQKIMREYIYEDTFWAEDAIFMERNSRDFLRRIVRINSNAEAICDVLRDHTLVKNLYYPLFNSSKQLYDAFRLPRGGYGGLLSIVFNHPEQAKAFYDALDTAKGPSLGTNFTLCSPYVLLAHYHELQWAADFGVNADLVRVSVGLEEPGELRLKFRQALQVAAMALR